jgi:hypothetical protein
MTEDMRKLNGFSLHHSHHLPSYNRITSVCANTKIEIQLEFFVGNGILDRQFLVVEIGRRDLVVEKNANILRGTSFF